MTWEQAINAFRDHLRGEGRTESTITGYLRHIRRIADAFSDRPPAAVTGQDLYVWIAARNWSKSTRSRFTVTLKAFYGLLVQQGACRRSPVPAAVKGFAGEQSKPGPARHTIIGPWRQPVSDYFTHLLSVGRTRGTVETRRWHLSDLARLVHDPWQVTADDLVDWMSSTRDLSPEYRRSLRNTARSFYSWAVDTGRTNVNPAAKIPAVRQRRSVPRPIPDTDLAAAVAAADDRGRLILLLAGLAGLRRVEIAGLHYRDVDFGGGELIIAGKGGDERVVPLHPTLAEELHAEQARRAGGSPGSGFPRSARKTGYVFPGQEQGHLSPRWVGKLAIHALPDGWTLHKVRHRFATVVHDQTHDLRVVQQLLGHSSPTVTARYAAVRHSNLARAVATAGIGTGQG